MTVYSYNMYTSLNFYMILQKSGLIWCSRNCLLLMLKTILLL